MPFRRTATGRRTVKTSTRESASPGPEATTTSLMPSPVTSATRMSLTELQAPPGRCHDTSDWSSLR
jgi:hypothetical protein